MNVIRRRLARNRPIECKHVAKVLQAVLDGEADGLTTAAVEAHLEACRHCGMEAGVYEQIKASLARSAPSVPPDAVDRLKTFAAQVVADDDD